MDFLALAQACAPTIQHEIMAALVKTESSFNPLAIGVNTGKLKRPPKSLGEAVATARELLRSGHNIDLGLGQINSANLKRTGLTVETAFNPCLNLRASSTILSENYSAAQKKYKTPTESLYAALSAYNTGSFTKGLHNGYVRKWINNLGVKPKKITVPPTVLAPSQASDMPVPLLNKNKAVVKLPDSSIVPKAPVKRSVETEDKPETMPSPLVFSDTNPVRNSIMVY